VKGSSLDLLDRIPFRDGDEVLVSISEPEAKDIDALRRAAGAWKGMIDADALIADIYADRLIATRPSPRGWLVRYLVDTDWVIHYLNGHREIVARVQDLSPDIALSVISLAELYEGVFYSRDPQNSEEALQDFLRGIELVGIDDEITRVFGRERGRLRAAGKTVGDFDLLLGATALRHGLTVLTNNRRHFELIETLQVVSL
jgi:tRNA(fMet)-specific endonuclease VapC